MNFNAEGSFLALLPFRLFWMAWVQSPVTSPDLPHLPDSSHFFPFLISPSQFMPPPFVEIGVSHNCQLHEIPLPSRKKKNSSYSKIDPSSFNFLLQVHQVCWFAYYSPPTLLSGWFSLELSISFPWTALTLPFYYFLNCLLDISFSIFKILTYLCWIWSKFITNGIKLGHFKIHSSIFGFWSIYLNHLHFR